MDDLSSRLARLRQTIDEAARRSGRNPDEIELIAVSKTQPVEAIVEAMR